MVKPSSWHVTRKLLKDLGKTLKNHREHLLEGAPRARKQIKIDRSQPYVQLVKPLERMIAHGHPWIYRDALKPFHYEVGERVRVLDRRGRVLAQGLVEKGPIAIRVFTRGKVAIGCTVDPRKDRRQSPSTR